MSNLITNDLINENGALIKELREVVEKKDADSAYSKEKLEKMNYRLDQIDEVSQKHFMEVKQNQQKFQETLDVFEKQISRIPANGKTGSAALTSDSVKAFEKFLRAGPRNMDAMEMKYLRTDSNVEGGFLCPPEFLNEIIKKITEISPIRQVARVSQTDRESVLIPTRESLVQSSWIGEGGLVNPTNSNYGAREIKTNKLMVQSQVTIEELQDAYFDLQSQVMLDVAEEFARAEGQAFVLGNSVNMPAGILTNPNIINVNSGISNAFNADNLITMAGQLKTGYNGSYLLNRRTLAQVRALKDGLGRYLWQELSLMNPNTILGHPYYSTIDVPDTAPGSTPILYGDWMRGYRIVDRMVMNTIRDDYTLAGNGMIRFIFLRRVAGQVVLPEAIIKLTISV